MKRALQDRYSLEDLLDILQDLRGPEGCPWDKVQDYDSLKITLRDEAQEVLDAVDKRDMKTFRRNWETCSCRCSFMQTWQRRTDISPWKM